MYDYLKQEESEVMEPLGETELYLSRMESSAPLRRGRSFAGSNPLAHQGGFPKTSWGRDEGQFTVKSLIQAVNQTRAENHLSPRRGDIQFSG